MQINCVASCLISLQPPAEVSSYITCVNLLSCILLIRDVRGSCVCVWPQAEVLICHPGESS